MKKRIWHIAEIVLFVLLMFALAAFVGACNNNGEENEGGENKVNYIIDTSSSEFTEQLVDGEIAEVYVIPIPKVLDRSSAEADGFSVSIDSVTDPEGNRVIVAARRFTPNVIGEFTIHYTCNDEQVRDGSAKVTIKDTTAPVINILSVSTFIFAGEETPVPEFEVRDAGGVDKSRTDLTLVDDKNNDIEIGEEYFSLSESGNYKFIFTACDVSGNTATAERQIYVTSESRIEGRLTYWTENSIAEQISAYNFSTVPLISWDENFKDPDGNGTLRLEATSTERYCAVAVSCAITDWTEYDYLGFWVYNPTDIVLSVGFIQISAEHTFVCKPNSWTYITLNAHYQDYIDTDKNTSSYDNRTQIVLAIYDRYLDKVPIEDGEVFHFSNITLYKDSEDDTKILHFGDQSAFRDLHIHEKYMDQIIEITDKYRFDGDEYSVKFTTLDTCELSFNARLAPKSANVDWDNPYYLLNVYNPNDYDIILIDNAVEGGASEGENYSTIIRAGESGKMLLKIRAADAYMCALTAEGERVPSGFILYIGSLDMEDQYTGDPSAWNATYGDAELAEIYG